MSLVIGLVVVVCVGLFFALVALGAVIEATGSASARATSGTSRGGDIGLAIVGVIIVAVCVVWAIHLEHRLRRHEPVAADYPPPSRAVFPRGSSLHRRGRYGPRVAIIYTVVAGAALAGLIVGVFVVHGEASRSARVQHHGIAASATVTKVSVTKHQGRSSTWYTSDVDVSLSSPVEGRSATVVRYPGRATLLAGMTVPVFIDPHDAGYAEFPGSPDTKSSAWIVMIVFAALVAVLLALLIRQLARFLRHRRTSGRTASHA